MKAFELIRSVIFLFYLYISIPAFGVFIILLPFLFFRPSFKYEVARAWSKSVLLALKIICGLSYEISGQENLPKRSCIILSKHSSTWETIALFSLFPKQTWVIKKELLFLPIFGQLILLFKPIPIDRKSGKKAVEKIISLGKLRLNQGYFVVIFPEGTRTSYPVAGRYGLGGSILSLHSGSPIIPVAHNAGKYWPRNKILKQKGKIKIKIGEPIYPKKNDVPEKIMGVVKTWIEGEIKKL